MNRLQLPFLSILGFGLLANCGLSMAQNLLPNPGFETISACPSGVALIANATPWFTPSGHGGSADLLHTCATSTLADVPSNAFGNQAAHSGNGYLGFALFYISTPNFREYAQVQLTTALVAGQTYQWRSWVSLGDNSTHTTDDLQFYFSASPTTWGSGWGPMTTYTPQASIPSGTLINDKVNWIQVSANYTALGGERYMTMGNFLTDATTTMVAHSAGSYNTGYIYFDDMELVPAVILSAEMQDLAANAGNEGVQVQWETRTESSTDRFEIERSTDDMHSWQKLGAVDAAGQSNSTKSYTYLDRDATGGIENHYRLRVLDLNGEFSYSNAVSAVPAIREEHLLAFHPNPVAAGADIETRFISLHAQTVDIELLDITGRTLIRNQQACEPGSNVIRIQTATLSPGNYLLRIRGGNEQRIQRLNVL